MVQVADGRLFMVGDHPDHQMLVFKPDGTILESWGSVWPGGHGLTLSNENGAEFLFVADCGLWKTGTGAYRQTGRVTKIDLTGREDRTEGVRPFEVRPHPRAYRGLDRCERSR